MDALDPPLLWGDWRCTRSERMFIAECQACGGELWIHRNGENDWRASCENGCTRMEIEAGATLALEAEHARAREEREARGALDITDDFYGIDAVDYIPALTGLEPERGCWFRCPFHAGGEERTPSLKTRDVFWYCHACGFGGTIYDFGAHLWDLEPRGSGFTEIGDRLARELLRVG